MVFLIAAYIIANLAYFGYRYRDNMEEGIFLLSISLFLPIMGYLLFIFLRLGIILKHKCNSSKCPSDISFEDEAVKKSIKSFDISKALNLVPIEEALLLNVNSIKRSMLLDMLKADMGKYPFLLKMALANEDTETSHYAAVGVVEVKRKLLQSLQECKRKYEKTKSLNELISYAYALKAYYSCGLLDEANEKSTMETYQDVLLELLEFYDEEGMFFVDKIDHEINTKNFSLADVYCKRFINAHKNSEKPYLMYLKLFYATRDKKGFNYMLDILEGSTVSLSSNTWSIVKFWREVCS